jgi:hypothetical protein
LDCGEKGRRVEGMSTCEIKATDGTVRVGRYGIAWPLNPDGSRPNTEALDAALYEDSSPSVRASLDGLAAPKDGG